MLPDIRTACSRHFVYADLIRCGTTLHRMNGTFEQEGEFVPVDNRPVQLETYESIRVLCTSVLDPVVDEFGPLKLTYGFACRGLVKHIASQITPRLDQHAGSEVNRTGKPTCARLGQAADFYVPGVDSRSVARWIIANTPFDRLYFYENDRPIHVSAGPQNCRYVVEMGETPQGKRYPVRCGDGAWI
jgi:hypothetical protein